MKGTTLIAIAILCIVWSVFAHAQDEGAQIGREHPSVIVVRRLPNGDLASDAERNVRALQRIARKNGYAVLWINLNVPFNPDIGSMSPEEARRQQELVERTAGLLMAPLIESGDADYFNGLLEVVGQGFTVRANATAVKTLSDSRIVNQIVGND
jgi:hypothetical protein